MNSTSQLRRLASLVALMAAGVFALWLSNRRMPYTIIGVALVLLAIVIGTFKLPKIETAASRPGERINDSIWKHPNLLLGAIATFTYVGAEVSIGSFLVNYFSLPEIAGFSAKTAAGFVSFYWGGAMIGGRVKTTNLPWVIEESSLAQELISRERPRGNRSRDPYSEAERREYY